MSYLTLPVIFLKFWFFEAPIRIIKYFLFLNRQFFHLFSLVLIIKTLFKPWKNEYRKGFIPVAIGIGFFVKLLLIIADLALFSCLIILEGLFLVLFEAWPIIAVYLFIK